MFLLGKQSFDKVLGGKESFYKVISKDSYDRLKFHIFARLGINPDYALVKLSYHLMRKLLKIS